MVHRAVVVYDDVPPGLVDAVDFEPRDAPIHAARIFDDDAVLGAAGPEDRAAGECTSVT